MRLALIFKEKDNKLLPSTYSQAYRSQFLALANRFEWMTPVTKDCNAKDIDADVIVFYDVHSSHHIKIDGIEKHPAVKYEYINDPHQLETKGYYIQRNLPPTSGELIHKLGIEQRAKRILERRIDYVICPSTTGYYQFLAPHIGKCAEEMLLWFPTSPTIRYFKDRKRPLSRRGPHVLANGAVLEGINTNGYVFRRWAFEQDCVYHCNHTATSSTPGGRDFPDFLANFAGALALNSVYCCPKYSEIPLAGCVAFVQEHPDYTKMGFRDGMNCIYVNKENFVDTINAFKSDVEAYQPIADAGRKLIEDNWTAEKFADFIYDHSKKCQ